MNASPELSTDSILDQTVAVSIRDKAMVTPDGKSLQQLIEGVSFREVPTHIDERGSVFECYDPRWGWHPDPIVFAYCFTIRPGFVKGWNIHREHEDRYIILSGELELVLYDPRPESTTCGMINRIVSSHYNRRVVSIPRNVWHADYNIGTQDAMVINFPTAPYDHSSPDKYRLPLDTPHIPYKFPADAKGF